MQTTAKIDKKWYVDGKKQEGYMHHVEQQSIDQLVLVDVNEVVNQIVFQHNVTFKCV